ncbi:DUF6791 domain-containing protein [Rhizobium beringeri]
MADPLNITNGSEVGPPANHQMYFIGGDPCGLDGQSLINVLGGGENKTLIFDENYSSFYYSHKLMAAGQMRDYSSLAEKFEQYYSVISAPAVYTFPEAEQAFWTSTSVQTSKAHSTSRIRTPRTRVSTI